MIVKINNNSEWKNINYYITDLLNDQSSLIFKTDHLSDLVTLKSYLNTPIMNIKIYDNSNKLFQELTNFYKIKDIAVDGEILIITLLREE